MLTQKAAVLQTPLSSTWSEAIISQQDRFTPEMLLAELQELNITVSMQLAATPACCLGYTEFRAMEVQSNNSISASAAGRYGDRLDKLQQVLQR